MKAVTISRYGGPEVLEYRDMPEPVPKANEVLIKVHASNVNPIDWKIRDGALKMFIRVPFPITMGVDLAGEVIEVGSDVRTLAVGDHVFAMMPTDTGAQAEFVAMDAELVVLKPRNMNMEEAASVPAAALTALQALRDLAKVRPDQRVLINGASGGVGLFAVQIARALHARVTAVCSHGNFKWVKSLGATRLIDYRTVDFTAGPERYDVVFDAVGNRTPHECRRIIEGGGTYINTSGRPALFLRQFFNFLYPFRVHPIIVKSSGRDLDTIRFLIETGRVHTVIDKTFPITEVAAAQEYSATGRARGKIVLTFTNQSRVVAK